MSTLPLAIPSGSLRGTVESCRVVNWMLAQAESGTGKGGARAYSKQCPGLRTLRSLGGPIRGLFTARKRLFAVAGDSLFELSHDLIATKLGVVGPGALEGAKNDSQLCIVNGSVGYVIDLETVPPQVQIVGELNGPRIDVLDGYGVFSAGKNAATFFTTANQDFRVVDPLSFATVESVPGGIRGHIRRQRQVIFFKDEGAEVWYDGGGTDFPLARDPSASIAVGLLAPGTLRTAANDMVMWLGRDDKGEGIVFALNGYTPERVSKEPLEQRLATVGDLSLATAWTYHLEGQSYYVLQVPGLDTTWVYDIAAGEWHERGDWSTAGEWEPWRATCHAFCFRKHLVGGLDGYLYELTNDCNRNGNDPLVRDFISPHHADSGNGVQSFRSLEVLCDVGQGTQQVTPKGNVERITFDGVGNFYNAQGQQTILTGWNTCHNYSVLNQADFQEDIDARPGDRVARIVVKYGGNYPAGVDCRDLTATGYIKAAVVAYFDAVMNWAEATGMWIIFALDSDCGQYGVDAYCNFYGVPNSNYVNNPTFFAEVRDVVWPFLVNRYKTRNRIMAWELWPEPRPPGATDKQIRHLYGELLTVVQGLDAATPCMIGGRGGYKARRIQGVYSPDFRNVIYTFDLLDSSSKNTPTLPPKVAYATELRERYGVPIFCQQVGVRTGHDPTYEKGAAVLDLLNAQKIGWAYWEKRSGTPNLMDEYSAYVPDGAGGWLFKELTYEMVVNRFQTQGASSNSLTSDAHLMLRYSNDGGKNWTAWQYLSLGNLGEYAKRVRTTQLGSARDRVWNFRVTDDVQVNLIAALVNEQ